MIDKMVLYHTHDIFERLHLPLSIGIVGESASGKSTITEDFIKVLSQYWSVTRVNTDDYYYDNSDAVRQAGSFAAWAKDKDLDSPKAMELSLMQEHIAKLKRGESVWLPKYDMSGTAIRTDKAIYACPSDIIISEGLFTMCIKDVFDICIYIDISPKIQKERWYARAKERALGEATDEMFKNADEKANIYIRPFKAKCDVIISGEGPRPRYKTLMEKILKNLRQSKTNSL